MNGIHIGMYNGFIMESCRPPSSGPENAHISVLGARGDALAGRDCHGRDGLCRKTDGDFALASLRHDVASGGWAEVRNGTV